MLLLSNFEGVAIVLAGEIEPLELFEYPQSQMRKGKHELLAGPHQGGDRPVNIPLRLCYFRLP